MRPITAAAAALAGLAFWRRKTLKEDTQRAKAAGKDAATKLNARLRGEADTKESTEEEAAPADDDDATGEDSSATAEEAATQDAGEDATEDAHST